MKRLLTSRQRHFFALFSGAVQSLLSFFLTLALILCLLLALQGERIGEVARWLKAEPATRAALLEALLEKSDLVERVSIATIERTIDADTDTRGWLVSDASFHLASGIEARFRSLSLLPRQLHAQGLQVSWKGGLSPTQEPTQETAPTEVAEEKSFALLSQEFWYKLVRRAGFLASLAPEYALTLEDSLILLEGEGQPLLRLRFDKIEANNRNGLTWRGQGIAETQHDDTSHAVSRESVVLTGNYAIASRRLYQSLRIEGISPRDMLRLIARNNTNNSNNPLDDNKATTRTTAEPTADSEATRLWLEGKGQLSIDYRFDIRERQSWFRARFARALDKKAMLSFDHSTDDRRTGSTNTSLSFRALPLGVVWQASNLLLPAHLSQKALPFQLSGIVSGRLSQQRQFQASRRFLGNLSLETPRFRWNEVDESVLLHRLQLTLEGNDEQLQVEATIDIDPTQESGVDQKITILPYEESATQGNILPAPLVGSRASSERASSEGARPGGKARKTWDPSKFRLTLEGASRGGVPALTALALWPPRFKSKPRATVVEVAKAGELTDLTIVLDALIDFNAKGVNAKPRRVTNLDGSFLWQKGRLQLFAEPATLTEIKADAHFTNKEILFKVEQARYITPRGDFLIEGGEVSFERQILANKEKHTLMRLALLGEGSAEAMRRFILNAPFLQEREALQQSARWIPQAPRATAHGHFNMSIFLAQLNDEAPDAIFPHPPSYDTAWQIEGIRLQAPFMRFYEGSATLASTSSIPLSLTARAQSDRGAVLQGRWLFAAPNAHAVRQQQEIQSLVLQGSLDARALESDFPYLPQGWFEKNLPIALSYKEKAGAATQGSATIEFPRARMRLESSQTISGEPVRLSGNIKSQATDPTNADTQTGAQAPAWQFEGRFRPQGKISLLIERGGGEQAEKPLALLLENMPRSQKETTVSQKTPAEWLLTLEGEEANLSRWLEQKPWRPLLEKKEEQGEQASSISWGEMVNLTFDARLKKLQLQKTATNATSPRSNDLLEQVRASLRWQDGKIHNASFSSHSLLFSRVAKRQRKQAQRRVRTRAFYTLREGKELFSAHIEDLGSFLHQTLGKNFADGGLTQISLVRPHIERQRPKPHLEGYAKIRNVSLYNLPLLLKIFDAVDFVSAFNEGISGLDLRSDLRMWDSILTLKEFRLSNNLTALSANGSLDLAQQKLDLRGEIATLHFVSKILRNIPLIGTIVVGNKKHNLFAFSYEAKGGWSNPKVIASPLNVLLPGIVKIANPLQLIERDDIKKAQDKKREQIADEQKKSNKLETTKAN